MALASLGYFNLRVYIGDEFTLEVHAGTSAAQAETPSDWFAVNVAKRSEIVEEVLLKLAAALRDEASTIDVNTVGKDIVRDKSFPMPHPVHSVLAAVNELQKSLGNLERGIS